MGAVSGIVGGYILIRTIRLLGPGENSTQSTMFVILAFILKWPVIFALGYVSQLLTMQALYAFAGGFSVVYFAMVWRALRGGLFNE